MPQRSAALDPAVQRTRYTKSCRGCGAGNLEFTVEFPISKAQGAEKHEFERRQALNDQKQAFDLPE